MGKSSQKKKGKKKDKEDAKKLALQEEEDEAEFEKATLELRVKELETLNLGLTQKCDYLESQNDVFKVQLDDAKQEKEDLVAHLQRSWTEEKTNVKELEDRLYGVSQARIDDAKDYDKRLAEKDKIFEEMKSKLEKNIIEIGAKLTALEEFRIQKDNLTLEREELTSTLQEERKRFEEKYDELDTQLIQYRERVKNDTISILVKMAESVRKAGKLCLTATVKSAISSNIRLQNELESMAKDNIKLRKKLEDLNGKFREKRMTIEVLEQENAVVHRKCNQYREVVQDLIQRQLWMEMQMRPVDELESELIRLKLEHSRCAMVIEDDIEDQIIVDQSKTFRMTVERENLSQQVKTIVPTDISLETEVKFLRDIIVKMALTAKDLSEAANEEELKYLKGRFKAVLTKLYRIASEIPDIPADVKFRLNVPVPTVSNYLDYSK